LIGWNVIYFPLHLYMPMETGAGRFCGIFGMIWNKLALLWLRFLGMDNRAVRLRQVRRPAAALGLGLQDE